MRSIDLHWVSKKEKDILLPDIAYGKLSIGCGCYYHPDKYEVYWNKKIIVLRMV